MPNVKVLRPHTFRGVVVKRGESYEDSERNAFEKVRIGLVEISDVRAKVDRDMYAPRSYEVEVPAEPEPEVEPEVEIVGRTGGWYLFSDGEKVLGKKAAAEKLGVEELSDVDFDDD